MYIRLPAANATAAKARTWPVLTAPKPSGGLGGPPPLHCLGSLLAWAHGHVASPGRETAQSVLVLLMWLRLSLICTASIDPAGVSAFSHTNTPAATESGSGSTVQRLERL